tara:strand:- start:61 stop:456 length:396 start_codon:yes stop_codon:yes gene_type:complete
MISLKASLTFDIHGSGFARLAVRLVNLTPDPVLIFDDDGQLVEEVLPSGHLAYIEEESTELPSLEGMPMRRVVRGRVIGLLKPEAGTLQIVDAMVFHVSRRVDVVAPGPLLRDSTGRVRGCIGLTALMAYR